MQMATREFNWTDFGMGAAGALLMLAIVSAVYFWSRSSLEAETTSKDDFLR